MAVFLFTCWLLCLNVCYEKRKEKKRNLAFYLAFLCLWTWVSEEWCRVISVPFSLFSIVAHVGFVCLFLILYAFRWLSLWGTLFFFPSVNFGNERNLSKAVHRNAALSIWMQTAYKQRLLLFTNKKWAEIQRQRTFTAKNKKKILIFLFSFLQTYFMNVSCWL